MRLRIRYRSGEDEVSEREISDPQIELPKTLHAHCHLRGEVRSFVLDRIEDAIDMETGESIRDIWGYFGVPNPKPPLAQMPVFTPPRERLTADQARNRRSAEKHALFRRFKYTVIAEAKKRQLWALFESRCFHCSETLTLDLDHHVPQSLGGRLVPGNIVLLCRKCNLLKRRLHPTAFYSADELEKLQPTLEAELPLFNFSFNWTRWIHHPVEYLVTLGVAEADAKASVTDPTHRLYVGYDPRSDVTVDPAHEIVIDMEEVLQKTLSEKKEPRRSGA